MIDTYILIGITGILNIVCFFIGAKVGQKVVSRETIKLPNPVKIIEEKKAIRKLQEEVNKEQERLSIINHNIDVYDGTAIGQKEIPK